MTTAVLPEVGSAPLKAVAPWWHTALLIAFFVLTAAGGAALQYRAKARTELIQQRPMSLSYMYRYWQGNGASSITFGKEGFAGAESHLCSSPAVDGEASERSSWI